MLTIVADIVLAVYLVLAFTTFNKPKEAVPYCSIVNIIIEDEDTNGFIKTKEIKDRLKSCHLYPIEKPMAFVDSRKIEETLKMSPFVKTAECYKTVDGHVNISITQRMPIVRIKANNGEDYYLDDHDCVMPNSQYTSDLIIATGNINKWFASNYIYRTCSSRRQPRHLHRQNARKQEEGRQGGLDRHLLQEENEPAGEVLQVRTFRGWLEQICIYKLRIRQSDYL